MSRGIPFSDLRDLNKAINDLFELAEVAWQMDAVLKKQNGGVAPLLCGGELELIGAWKKAFGTPYYDIKPKEQP